MSDPSQRYVLSADGFDIYDRWYSFEQVYTTPRYEIRCEPSITVRTRERAPAAHARTYRTLDPRNAAHEAWLGKTSTPTASSDDGVSENERRSSSPGDAGAQAGARAVEMLASAESATPPPRYVSSRKGEGSR